MKQQLRQIYQDLANGKLSKSEALEAVKGLMNKNNVSGLGTLLANPIWKHADISGNKKESVSIAGQYVLVYGLKKVKIDELKALIPTCNIVVVPETEEIIPEQYTNLALSCFEQIQKILKQKLQGTVLLQLVTNSESKGKFSIGLEGMLKTATLENPLFRGQIILTNSQITANELSGQIQENSLQPSDKVIKYESARRLTLNWIETETAGKNPSIALREDGVYLITGGMGGLGILFAKEILKQTSRAKIILTGRSGLTNDKKTLFERQFSDNQRVIYKKLDVENQIEIKQFIDALKEEYQALHGILYCAGSITDNFILKKSSEEIKQVLAPKVTGIYNIDETCKNLDLDFMAFFSSVASVVGNLGQSDYAAANGFMDQYAAYRNQLCTLKQRKGKTVSINWPLWQDGGMKIDQSTRDLLKNTMGMHPMQTQTGLNAFYNSLMHDNSQAFVMEGELETMYKSFFSEEQIYTETLPNNRTLVNEGDTGNIMEKILEFLRKEFSSTLKLPAHKIDTKAALEKYGIDSIMAINLVNQLEKTFGSLPKTLFFEYQTIRELADYFIKSHSNKLAALYTEKASNKLVVDEGGNSKEQLSQPAAITSYSPRRRRRLQAEDNNEQQNISFKPGPSEPIAIVGLSGRYPESENLEEFWDNLSTGTDCITEVPKERWDLKEYYSEDRTKDGYHFSKWGGFISGVDEFDPRFFNISPREAETIDPQERLFLQHAWMAIEDAGYTRPALQFQHENDLNGQVGVYVGLMWSEYQLLGPESSMQGKRMGIGGSFASIANRVSYTLNLHGPSITVDTMCSSSLTAIHMACQDLKQGRTDMAIAGGVNVSIHPNKYLILSAGQFISSDGHCQSFGEGGDGYIPGEGVGAVILKRLSDAQKDGNHVYGIIKGSALNHGGKTNGYSVPTPQAQASVINRALIDSNTDARHISYIEAHGTGTKLGDPIEIAALSKTFNNYTKDTGFCLIGSAKSNIGHCESAAGIAGVTKVLLQLKYKQIVPSLHSSSLNPNIDFEKTPFIVNQSLSTWERPVIDGKEQPRIAGVSSFGAGGSNAHIIIEEYIEPVKELQADTQVIIPLSARTQEQLKQKASELKHYLSASQTDNNSPALLAVAYTLQLGREAMAERIGLIVSSVTELIGKLQAYANGEQNIEDIYQGRTEAGNPGLYDLSEDDDMKETIQKWISNRKLSKLTDFWVKGLEFDWNKLYDAEKPSFISLPAYPFARERYWVQIPNNKSVVNRNTTSLLHSLVHENTSDLKQQSYSSSFSGEELFFISHQSGHSEKILMPSCYLEMARVAVVKSLNLEKETGTIVLNTIVWGENFTVPNNEKITIALFSNGDEQVDYEIYSKGETDDVIHCQGQAQVNDIQLSTPININQLKNQVGGHILNTPYSGIETIQQGEGQLLIHLKLDDQLKTEQTEFALHPIVMNSLLDATKLLSEQRNTVPELMRAVKIHSSIPAEAYAWVRYSADNMVVKDDVVELDIDVCDTTGKICIQFIGVQYELANSEVIRKPANQLEQAKNESLILVNQESVHTQTEAKQTISYPRKIKLVASLVNYESINLNQGKTFSEVSLKKPSGISLSAPAPISIEDTSPEQKVKVSLEISSGVSSLSETRLSETTFVCLIETEEGVFTIQINSADNNTLSNGLIAELLLAVQVVKQEKLVKVLIIEGNKDIFLQGDRNAYNNALENNLFHEISLFPYPLIAAMQGNAEGIGFLIGALCDFMVCSNHAHYFYKNLEWGILPDVNEQKLFEKRFGEVFSTNFLYHSTLQTGEQLKENGIGCIVVPAEQVASKVQNMVAQMSGKSMESLRLLKEHLSRDIAGFVNQLTRIESVELNEKTNKIKESVKNIKSPSQNIRLETPQSSTLLITIQVNDKIKGTGALVKELSENIQQAGNTPSYKTIIIDSDYEGFFPAGLEDLSVKEVLGFQRLMFESKLPVITLLKSDTSGIGWFLSLFSDACVYNKEASYSISNNWKSVELAKKAALIFKLRFGAYFGKELLLTGNTYTGLELQKRVANTQTAHGEQLLSKALQLAEVWLKEPQESVCGWKAQLVADIKRKIRNLPAWNGVVEDTFLPVTQTTSVVPLKSGVIKATAHKEGILEVKMEDREAKNMFSDAFVNGIIEVFEHIESTPSYKAVILTGYYNYFASGGTKESLLSIQEGKVKFTDSKIYHLAMDCKVPVISAMQGHGIGAGWSLGMFADFILFSEESRYVSPYMNYGFTPGAGATYIFPEKMGYDLARETMLTANEYSGIELKDRGMLIPVLPREQVKKAAFELARQISKGNYNLITGFKYQFTYGMHEPLEFAYQCELDMHEKTFVGQKDTLQQIENKFYQEKNKNQTEPQKVEKTKTLKMSVSTESSVSLSGIMANLKKLLAVELRIGEHEIRDNLQFIDLGLDSITGVTWVRKINELYHTAIEATEVYTYPTLDKLGKHVKEELEKITVQISTTVQEIPVELSVPKPVENIAVNTGSGDLTGIISSLKKLLAEELRIAEYEINENMQFVDLGLDSITGVTLVRKINEKYKTSFEATEVYSYPTLVKLGQHVRDEAEKLGALAKPETEQVSVKPLEQAKLITSLPVITMRSASKKLLSLRSNRTSCLQTNAITYNKPEPVAVIGMAGQFPQAKNIDEFWKNIAEAKNCIEEIPGERWSIDDYYREGTSIPGKMNSKWMGALEEYDMFDPFFFNISPKEAINMDPQQRLFLQTCWHTIENAGYNPFELSGSKCGVFVGCGNSDYHQISREHQLSAQGFTGSSTSILSGRVSYLFNLHGPSISIETACSSSLVAIANACDSLNSGGSDLAIAGGVYIMAGPDMHIKCSQTGMLSADGRCFTFDQRANGFVPGEGVGAVLLKRLSDAERDQDIIYGVIQGWGINQDGQTNGITAPNPEAQTRLEQEVYDKFSLDPECIQLIEAHGTGTKLGDPIEVRALKDAFKKYTQKKEYCALTSVKSNIGHCLTAAGVASFIKTIQAIKNKQLPPTINYNQLNEHIDLNGSPFYINDMLSDWKKSGNEKRMAAISSFGFSGTNAHIVVSEYAGASKRKQPITVITQNNKYIFPLSAKTEEQLLQKAEDLLSYIRNEGASVDIIETAYTLQIGREAMDVRLAILASSFNELELKLQAYLEGKEEGDIYSGHVKQNREGINIITQDDMMKEIIQQQYINNNNLSGILNLWCKGLSFDWNRLYGAEKPQRVNLPVYPFAKEKYWIEATNTMVYASPETSSTQLHPLLHSNTFDLREYTNGITLDNQNTENHKSKHQKLKRISLPKYAFTRERCWVDSDLVIPKAEQLETLTLDMESIEAIINKIEYEALDTDKAVQLIKSVAKN